MAGEVGSRFGRRADLRPIRPADDGRGRGRRRLRGRFTAHPPRHGGRHAAKLPPRVDEPGHPHAVARPVDLLVAGLDADADAALLDEQVAGGVGPGDHALRLKAVAVEAGRSEPRDLRQRHEGRLEGRRRRRRDPFHVVEAVDEEHGTEQLAPGVADRPGDARDAHPGIHHQVVHARRGRVRAADGDAPAVHIERERPHALVAPHDLHDSLEHGADGGAGAAKHTAALRRQGRRERFTAAGHDRRGDDPRAVRAGVDPPVHDDPFAGPHVVGKPAEALRPLDALPVGRDHPDRRPAVLDDEHDPVPIGLIVTKRDHPLGSQRLAADGRGLAGAEQFGDLGHRDLAARVVGVHRAAGQQAHDGDDREAGGRSAPGQTRHATAPPAPRLSAENA